ncbi:MAG: nitroreductase [Nocardioides sp.]|nr:nitroreductase [Nocardioides sp.]
MTETDAETILSALMNRRSVRFGFDGRPVSRDTLECVVACGLAAPSSKNAQPWRFHVLTDRSVLDELADAVSNSSDIEAYVPHDPKTGAPYPQYRSTVRESAQVLREAPATIWVENLGAFSAGRKTLISVPQEALAGSLAGYGFELLGIGAAVENMWIAANALGLAVSFMGDVVIAESVIAARLGFQSDLLGVLALGYSVATPRPPMDVRSFADSARAVWHDEV